MTRDTVALMAVILAAGLLQAGSDAASDDRVLARWTGGALTETGFIAELDHNGEALRRGGAFLEKQVCKAVFRTIYGERARQSGIDSSPAYLEASDEWRETKLARSYQRLHLQPMDKLVSDVDVMRYYEENRDRLYTSSGSADIAVLFVRCGDESPARECCRDKMETYRDRITTDATVLDVVIAEERELSGKANGRFMKVPLSSLAPELRDAVLHTPAGFSTPVIETPVGLFWVRVLDSIDPAPIPFARVENHVRQVVEREAVSRWRMAEAARLREELDLSETALETECLAAAAMAEGLDLEGAYIADERAFRAWKLADLAFFNDPEILPGDTEIASNISRPEVDSKYRRFDVDLLVVTVGHDRYQALDTAEAVRRALMDGALPASLAKPDVGIDGVELIRLSAVSSEKLHRISKQLAEQVLDTKDGAWFGPLAYPKSLVIPIAAGGGEEDLHFPACIIFAVRAASRMPTVDEVRDEVYRSFRDEITIVDRFTEVFGARWGLELLVGEDRETAVGSEEPSGSGRSD